jgi:hypothetical protein
VGVLDANQEGTLGRQSEIDHATAFGHLFGHASRSPGLYREEPWLLSAPGLRVGDGTFA